MGGQWIGPTQARAHALVRDLGLRVYPTYDEGKHTVEWRGRLIRHTGRIPWLGATTLADIGLAQYRLDHPAPPLGTPPPWTAVNPPPPGHPPLPDSQAPHLKPTRP